MSSLNNLSKRLEFYGGGRQVDRMNKDKLRSLKKALYYSYQSATMKLDDNTEYRCLMNPNKLTNDYDVKVLSVPFIASNLLTGDEEETNISAGKVFEWKETNSHWIVCLQHLEETAYFRAEVRRCRFSIDINGRKYWIYMRGPIETGMIWIRSQFDYFNKLNETAFMYIEKNEETLEFFSRFRKIKIADQYWEVQATDKLTVDGIIEVALKEDFTNNFEEEPTEIKKEDIGLEPMIYGPQVLKPFSIASYSLKNIAEGGDWEISNPALARIKTIDGNNIIIEIITGKSGQFTLKYIKDNKEIELLIKILSL